MKIRGYVTSERALLDCGSTQHHITSHHITAALTFENDASAASSVGSSSGRVLFHQCQNIPSHPQGYITLPSWFFFQDFD